MQVHTLHGGGRSSSLRRVGPPRPSLRPHLTRPCRVPVFHTHASAPQRVVEEAVEESDPASPFLEPLVRSFLLGIGAGVIFESGHVLFKFLGLAVEAGTHDVMESLAHHIEAFSPLFVWDHVAALGCMLLLYVVEAMAIVSVLDRYPDDSKQAATTIRSMVTLPKRMLPWRLTDIKRATYAMLSARQPRTAVANPAATTSPVLWPSPAAKNPSPAAPLKFVDTPVADVIADVNTKARAPLPRLPQAPAGPKAAPSSAPAAPGTRPASDALRARRAQKQLVPGQLDPDSLFGRQQREVLDRRSYLRNFWYAAALSDAIPHGRPVGVDLMGSRVMLYRDPDQGGRVVAMDDFCPHRGAPLSMGWLAKEPRSGHTCTVCPYHGWAFGSDGHVRDMPSAEPGRWPKRQLLSTYPVEEQGGLVWLFFGDKGLPADERPPLPTLPELEDPSWHVVRGELGFEAGHWAVFDQAMEVGALQALGDGSGGAAPQVVRDTFDITTQFSVPVAADSPLHQWTGGAPVQVTARAMLPSTSSIRLDLGGGAALMALISTTPVSEERSVNRFALMRNFDGGEGFDAWARRALFQLLGEDTTRLEEASSSAATRRSAHDEAAAPLGATRSNGASSRPRTPDAGASTRRAFQALRKEWMDMGYGTLPESVARRRTLADQ